MTTYDPLERVRKARRQAASVSALVVLAGVLLSIVVLRVWLGRETNPAPATNTTRTNGSGPDLRWEPFRPGQDLPESLSAGPSKHVENRVGGFARNHLGAALAAIHLGARVDPAVGSTTFEPTIREQVVGSGAEQLLENTKAAYEKARREEGRSPGEGLDPGSAHLVAYKIESHSPDAATVAVISADGPELYSARFELHWVDDDWHLVAPPGGDYKSLFTRLQALPVGAVALSRGT